MEVFTSQPPHRRTSRSPLLTEKTSFRTAPHWSTSTDPSTSGSAHWSTSAT